MNKPPFELVQANKWFAIELNNLAWDLIEVDTRTADQTEQMIHMAHASCFHWLQVGDLLNHLRALGLVAAAHLAAGQAAEALRHAQKAISLSESAGDTQTAFDRATTIGCLAHALLLNGQKEQAKQQYAIALAATEQFDHPEDLNVFFKLYPSIEQ